MSSRAALSPLTISSRSVSILRGSASVSQPGSPTFYGRISALPSPCPLSVVQNDGPPDLTDSVSPLTPHGHAFGGQGDVSKAIWKRGKKCYFVAVKHIRPQNNTLERNDKTEKRLRREIYIWSRLYHPNIVPLFGTITSQLGNFPLTSMVSAWMKNGNLSDYLTEQLLTVFERIQILCEVAAGLVYLHSKDIIHGDLSGSNILLNEGRHACLSDFGMSSIKVEFIGTSYWSSTIGGAIRWRAPELLPSLVSDVYNFQPDLSSRCDIYSFGSVMLQVLSNKIPYDYIRRAECVLIELFHRHPPRRPDSQILLDKHWRFIEKCWGTPNEPWTRPPAREVLAGISVICDATV
ncbi:hypothetical protein HWV62_31575 [Athelia sp. TMB]|nr:hypothetical protein HWV62_31575 [Athelia sp. TMB]